ncbi:MULTISPECIES: NADP-dependent oxidoreductase [unclassified Massilia]|uniref:NADP-dependent oxidoreductase n=1 Tax=unclassified Massilia TaxID=2609279 RepID=UPI001B81D091|nr:MULTISPECIES: NADP-dependent oxidoreductase [unclassified Massilia]MBQ5939466.1 NADP-dependent oxidoreductase [Massilia sp. AB1]MBQ5962071.1 NADP-dependent oxidoreductase [Massilia sp. ZL223]
MLAVRIHQYGNRDALSLDDIPIPDIAPDEVLVKVVAASVNPVDWKVREGYLAQMIPHPLPLTLGWDVSGVVVAVGGEVSNWREGDAVFARPDLARNGTYAEFVAIRASECARKPATISHVEAAALPLAGITAWESMVDTAAVQAGQRVLVHAGSGGVGSLAIQLLKDLGATVIATTSERNRALVESLGADQVVDYRTARFTDVVEPVDAVFDTLGGQVQEDSWQVLKPGGIQVSIISPPDADQAAARGVRQGFVFIGPNAPVLTRLAAMVDSGRLRPVIGAEFALRDIAAAHALSESGRAVGKIVLYVGTP